MEYFWGGLLTIAALAAGLLLGKIIFGRKSEVDLKTYQDLERRNIGAENQLKMIAEERTKIQNENTQLNKRIIELEKSNSVLETEKTRLKEQTQSYQEDLARLKAEMTTQFENLANQIFTKHSQQLTESSEKNLLVLLNPLKEKIHEFQKKVEESYSSEARERFALKKEIEKIVEANAVMTLETKNLTQALKGDVKSQGNWGEIVLERVLNASGLREGEEYIVQGKAMGLVDEEGKLQKPDVIINLPDEKHLIVDSKVSLVHYEQYISESSPEKKGGLLESFKQSIYNHINGLASKKYQHNEQLISPDFVMMFFPIEGALSLALQSDPELFQSAWNKSIVIVSPTTLLATLRTVASVWKQDRQTKNAMEIANQGGKLYDKFVGFVEDLEEIGKKIHDTETVYESAMNKLKTGKGNLISRVDSLKNLGAKHSKNIPKKFLTEESDRKEIESGE